MKTRNKADGLSKETAFRFAMAIAWLVLTPGPSLGAQQASGSDDQSAWEAFAPPPDEYDWIQLTSGEWLKGELTALYNFTLEFDSDKLGLLEFDWEDVEQIIGHGNDSVSFRGAEKDRLAKHVGVLRITGQRVVITDGDERREIDRADVVAIAPGEPLERNFWSGNISFGFDIQRGNTDLTNYSVLGRAKRRTATSRLRADYVGSINATGGVETANNHRISTFYDRFRTPKRFWRMIDSEYFRDTFSNVNNQLKASTSFGFHLIRTSKTEWDITAGGGFLYTEYVSVLPGLDLEVLSPGIGASTNFDTELTSWLDFTVDYSFNLVNDQSGRYLHHFVSVLSTDVFGMLDFDVTLIWDHVQDPIPQADGTVPKQDQLQFLIGLGYDF